MRRPSVLGTAATPRRGGHSVCRWQRSRKISSQPMRPTLLIVDDETRQMEALCRTLAPEGYEVTGVSTPEDALAALRERSFDVMLTDLMMPGMDGIALLKASLELDPDLVGVMMTGHGTVKTAVEAMKVGALDYILKPF